MKLSAAERRVQEAKGARFPEAPIPLVDLTIQHEEIAEEVLTGIADVARRSDFILGPELEQFEERFAEFCRASHCIGVSSGTDALELALRAVGVWRRDEVILPANTFIGSALAVVRAGAIPLLVDVEEESHLISVEEVEANLGRRTAAVMPVHLYGQIAPVEQLRDLISGTRVSIVEDAAQAHGAARLGTPAGSLGEVAGFSFYPGKNLGAYGDAGAITTNSDEVADAARALRNHGSREKYVHETIGFNCRLDTVQAVVLLAKLKRLERWNEQRRQAAEFYDRLLDEVEEVRRPTVLPGNLHVWHLYVVRVPRRDEVLRRMRERGIQAGIHYPIPIHLQGALRYLGHSRGDFPVTEALAAEILSLPIFPGITPSQQERVVAELASALS